MQTFSVYLNGKRLCVAGFDAEGVLVVNVNAVSIGKRKEFALNVGGLNSATNEHLRWQEARKLKVGDEIKLVISNKDSADEPRRKFVSNSDPLAKVPRRKKPGKKKDPHLSARRTR